MSVIGARMKVVRPYRCPQSIDKPNCCGCVFNKGFIPVAANEWPSIQVLCEGDWREDTLQLDTSINRYLD